MTPRERARRLVVEQGATLADAAEAAGLSVSAVEKASAADGWQQQRREHLAEVQGYHSDIRTLKIRLLSVARLAVERDAALLRGEAPVKVDLQSLGLVAADVPLLNSDAAIKHWRALETAFPERHYTAAGADPEARRRAFLECLEVIYAWAAEHDPNLLGALQPHTMALGEHIDRLSRDD